jgi:hypothetical protein
MSANSISLQLSEANRLVFWLRHCIPIVGALISATPVQAVISLTGTAPTYSQDFDSLATSGASNSWTNDSTLPGWSLFRRPAPGTALATYAAGNGSSTAGAIYSFGTDSDRALGGVGSGGTYWGSPASSAVAGWFAVALSNDTGSTIDSFTLDFDGEQWRQGGNTTPQTMALEYGFGADFTSVSTWTAPGGNFDFTSPITTGPGTLDGNSEANRADNRGGLVSDLLWEPSNTLWVRWIENNDSGNDHGLAVDNFNFSATTVGGDPIPGDFDSNGVVDGEDFADWQSSFPKASEAILADGDGDGDGDVDGADFVIWQTNFSAPTAATSIPEPSAIMLSALGIIGLSTLALRRRNRA